MRCSLGDLQVGQAATIVGYAQGHPAYRARLLAMGLTRGTPIRLVGAAPLGDPLHIEVRGYSLSLRRDEAQVLLLEVDPIPEAAPSRAHDAA